MSGFCRLMAWLVVAVWCFLRQPCPAGPGVGPRHVPQEVPEKYRAIYREIDAEIDRQLPLVPLPWGQKTGTVFGVELLAANRNRGEALLGEQILQATALTLDRLKALGVQSVSLRLQYPVLTRNHPRTADYREFYRRVAAEIRKRGLESSSKWGRPSGSPSSARLRWTTGG